MHKLYALCVTLSFSAAAFAQAGEMNDSSITTSLVTWLPLVVLLVLWFFFFKRMSLGKGGYGEYMRVTQGRMERIEGHLADIAESLRKIAESSSREK